MQTFLRRLSILESLRVKRTSLSTDELLSILINEGHVEEALPRKSQLRMIQRDLNFLLGDIDEDGDPENEFGLEREAGDGRTIYWRLDPYQDIRYDFEKMPQNMAIAFAMIEKHLSDLLPRNTHQELNRLFSVAEEKLSHSNKGISSKDFKRFRDSIEFYQRGQSLEAAEFDLLTLDTIYRAVINQQQLGFEYRGKVYRTNPLGVAILLPKLYLIAIKRGDANSEASTRRFLIHKIDRIWLESASAVIPDNFVLADYLKAGQMDVFIEREKSEIHQLVLEIDMDNERLVEDLMESPISSDQEINYDDSGRCRVYANVRWTVQLRNWLLSIANNSEVIAPPLIRQGMIDFLNQSRKKYS